MTIRQAQRVFIVQGAVAATQGVLAGSMPAVTGRAQASDAKPVAAAGRIRIGGDLRVNRIGFGAAEITGEQGWGKPCDPQAMHALPRRAVDLGVNFFDTADMYGPPVSERLIHKALHPYPQDLVIEAKVGQIRRTREECKGLDGQPEHLRERCEASLKRLQPEQIPLYQMHWPDPNVPYSESIGELARLQKEGKICHIGVCNVDAALLATARSIATIVSAQNRCNVVQRQSDDMLTLCEREQVSFMPCMPHARCGGVTVETDSHLAALQALATERHIDLPQAALAWLLARAPVVLSDSRHIEDRASRGQRRRGRGPIQRGRR